MNMLLSLPQHLRVNYFVVELEVHCHSAKHQQSSFHETESSQTFLNILYQILQINYFLFHFNRINILVCFLIL